jgi:hypothetical protein
MSEAHVEEDEIAPEPVRAPVARMSEMQDIEDGITAQAMKLRSA